MTPAEYNARAKRWMAVIHDPDADRCQLWCRGPEGAVLAPHPTTQCILEAGHDKPCMHPRTHISFQDGSKLNIEPHQWAIPYGWIMPGKQATLMPPLLVHPAELPGGLNYRGVPPYPDSASIRDAYLDKLYEV